MSTAVHPLAALIPEMTADQFADLRSDIEQHGLMESITLHEGMVLDGRHRLRACEETGVAPRFEDFNGPSPVEFVISKNLKRRHLTTSQLAAIAVDLLPVMEEEARERQAQAGRDFGRGSDSSVSPDTELSPRPSGLPARAAEEAGALVGVSGVSVARAKRVHEQEPEMFEQVKAGTLTVSAADTALREESKKNGVYRDGSRKRSPEYLVQNIIEKLRGTVAALEHVDTATAVSSPDAPLAQWDDDLTEIIVPLHQLRGAIRKVLSP